MSCSHFETMARKMMMLFVIFITCCSAMNYQERRCQDQYGSDLTKNFALGQSAIQSSTFNNGGASRLTDGNKNPYFSNNSCSETNVADDVSWEVQLAEAIYITSVSITTRADPYWPYSDYFEIKLKDETANEYPSPCASGMLSNSGATMTYGCHTPYRGKAIRIVLPGVGKRLSLCEVEVHGRESEFFDKEVNYALRQPAWQVSTGYSRPASRAVDGNRDVAMDTSTCTHTSLGTNPQWWKVDLGKDTLIYAVTITNRHDAWYRLNDFEIFISRSEKLVENKGASCDGRQGMNQGETRTIFCKQPLRGRYLAIVSRKQDVIHFCELYVQGWEDGCIAPRPLGMESFRVLDSQISASSVHTATHYAPENARLHYQRFNTRSACWIPAYWINENHWLQVDFLWLVTVTQIWTQGCGDPDNNKWTKTYKMSYAGNGVDFQYYTESGQAKIFPGNWDADTIARNSLSPVIVTRFIRLYPLEKHLYIALRVEFLGCYSGDEGYRRAKPLGMENSVISDSQLTVSSYHQNGWVKNNGRLNIDILQRGGWMAMGTDTSKWFQVDFILIATVVEILTQGAWGTLGGQFYTKTYQVSYGYDDTFFQAYKENGQTKTFSGNSDANAVVGNSLSPAIVARFIRVFIKSWQGHPLLRLEFMGFYKECADPEPLGMQDGTIRDSQITASSQISDPNFLAINGRLNWQANKCWITYEPNSWLQVSFGRFTKIVQISTQGRWGDQTYSNWVKSYYLSYGNDGLYFYDYAYRGNTKIFQGNSNKNSVVSRHVDPAIVARYIRVHPVTWSGHVALTLEFLGCYLGYEDSCENVPGRKPLGMENFEISDSQLSASSQYRNEASAAAGRLNYFTSSSQGGSWFPSVADTNQWLQVDFLRTMKVTGLATQGRYYSQQWLKEYTLSYKQGKDDIEFQFYKKHGQLKVFTGNKDRLTVVRQNMEPYINARILRINPKTWFAYPCLRAEFYGFEADLIDGDYTDVDYRITASSWLDHRHQPFNGVISGNPDSTSWTPAVEKTTEFIQVDLLQPTPLAGVELRGAADFPDDSYTLLLLHHAMIEGEWNLLKDRYGKTMKLLTSNCYREFDYYVLARFVRFTIASWGRRTSFRFQLHEIKAYERTSAGVEEGIIMDDQLKSCNHPDDPHSAREGRLNFPGAWCGNTMREQMYLQVDFQANFQVHALLTQGKDVSEYVTQYKLSNTLDEIHWNAYEEDGTVKLFIGNKNCQCSHKNFVQPFLARSLRVLPTAWVNRPCMRIEVFGVYKGILAIHARSGAVVDKEGTVVSRQSFIKLNGKEVIDTGFGYNIVVVDYITGDLKTSVTFNPPTDFEQLNNFLRNISDRSIVVISPQDVEKLPPDETLNLLESLGAIRLRYSTTTGEEPWVLVGYKGIEEVDWITEKIGKVGEAVKVAVFVSLNQRDLKPKHQEYFQNPASANISTGIEGRHTELFYNTSSRCGVTNTDCQETLSLAMWMKNDLSKYTEETASTSREERFVFKYYSNGYNYIVPKQMLSWSDARRYCQAIQGDLTIIPDKHTLHFIADLLVRENIDLIFIGSTRHPNNLHTFFWPDGSSMVFTSWANEEPNSLDEQCVELIVGTILYNDIACDVLRHFVCQQSIEDLTGLEPLGMENDFIPDSSITSSSIINIYQDNIYARPNTQRNTGRSWCAIQTDKKPYLQVDLAHIKSVCAIGTMGRGSLDYNYAYPISYSVQRSNDSYHWTLLTEGNTIKVFKANEDRNSMVINRFFQEFLAQFIRVNFLTWNNLFTLCARVEIFACKEDETGRSLKDDVLTATTQDNILEDCVDILISGGTADGVYMINPGNEGAFPVYCDQTTDGGGWTVFQRRIDGAVDFYRTWDEYANGFGDLLQEHWLGNEKLLRITNLFPSQLRIDLERFSGETSHVTRGQFKLMTGSEAQYTFYSTGSVNGPAGDSLHYLNGKYFSTKDEGSRISAAQERHSGWWFTDDGDVRSNLNGKYYSTVQQAADGIFWYSWTGDNESLKGSKMMMRSTGQDRSGPLGVQSAFLRWAQINTNAPPVPSHQDHHARLNTGKYWKVLDSGYYLEFNFNTYRRVTHFATQGGTDLNYVEKFFVRLKDKTGFWKDYVEDDQLKIFEGNNERTLTNEFDTVSNCLYAAELIRTIRFHLVSCSTVNCSLRIELYSCDDACSSPLGVGGDLPDDRMSASSWKPGKYPHLGRLSKVNSWCAEFLEPNEFLQVNFLEVVKVTYVSTLGYIDNGLPCFVKSYSIMYKNRKRKWIVYKNDKIFHGNINPSTLIRNKIGEPFLALSLRFVVKTWHNEICLRTEVYGCYPDTPKFVLFTDTAIAGRNFNIQGRYRYCQSCECPGCKKSICLRVFDKVHILAAHFSYDCQYHDFNIAVHSAIIPGVYKVYISDSENSNCSEVSQLTNERMVGSIAVSNGYTNCLDLLLSGHTKSGQYSIDPDGNGEILVYCDQEKYGGGWTVFQRRVDGSENFNRDWQTYKHGFGELERNFWLGNDFIHRLTPTKRELLFEANSENGDHAFVLYKSFQVNNEEDKYRAHVSEYQESVANCLQYVNGKPFSTFDRDNDLRDDTNCADVKKGAWWFGNCGSCLPNGPHGRSGGTQMKFGGWTNNKFLKGAELKIRSKDVVTCNERFCYYLLKQPHHWSTSRDECRRFRADLVSIADTSENEWIANTILREQNIDEVHLGMRNATMWTDGSKVLFRNYISSSLETGCPVLRNDGSWVIRNCSERTNVLCKRGKSCFKGQCYIYNAEEMNSTAAQSYCRDLGYDLVKISSEKEQNVLKAFIHASIPDSSYPDDFWLGLVRLNGSSAFSWVDGTQLDFHLWEQGEPDENENQCARLQSNGEWKDASCDSIRAFPCEKVLDPGYVTAKDCLELLLSGTTRSGVYSIDPDGLGSFQVYCDQESFGGGWTVLMRRVDGSESFKRTWQEYKNGFGCLDRNFWLGNERIHRLTATAQEATFDIQSDAEDVALVFYENFKVDGEDNKYKLTIDGYEISHGSDSMADSNGMFFTTKDRDNDAHTGNCANISNGGWWYKSCASAYLTGTYEPSEPEFKIRWDTWTLSNAEMKIRRKSIVKCKDKKCFYWLRKKKSWHEALDECRNFNADLVSTMKKYGTDDIANISASIHGHDEIYLGLVMKETETWTDGTIVLDNPLLEPLPENKCVVLKANGNWTIVDCEEPRFVVCERSKFCYKGNCYLYGGSSLYRERVTFCDSRGFGLAKITSREEHEYFMKVMKIYTSESLVFTGLRLVGSDYQWTDGSKLQYNQWSSGEPTGTPESLVAVNNEGFVDVPDAYTLPVLCEKVPILTSCAHVSKHGRSQSGVYSLHQGRPDLLRVYCDLSSSVGSWTVIQRRTYNTPPSDYASKTWQDYKNGFGELGSNFWLGNKYIHQLTKIPQRLKIILHTVDFNVYEAIYEDFTLGDEASKFVLNFGAYSGTAGDSLSFHRGMKFTTLDQDNDPLPTSGSCTSDHPGGWWFANCLQSNLNGVFSSKTNNLYTLYWKTISQAIIKTEMKIQAYKKVADFLPDGLIQNEVASLGVTFTERILKVDVKTSSQYWTAMIPNPGPFPTHVAITWEDNSYLRYYENGTLLAEVPAVSQQKLANPNGTHIQYAWLNELALFDRQLTKNEVKIEYERKSLGFEEDSYLWNITGSNYNWNVIRGCTPSNLTGPCGDHNYLRSNGSFAFAEASFPAASGEQTFIESPVLPGIYKCLSFWYHQFGVKVGSLNVYLMTNSSILDISVTNVSGNHGNYWKYMEVDVDISNVFKIVFEATRGDSFKSDVAIDDVTLFPEECKKECKPPCGIGEKCDPSSLTCFYEGIFDHRWTLDLLNTTEETTLSRDGRLNDIEGVLNGAIEVTQDGKIIFEEFTSYCKDAWCFPLYTLSFWLKYEDVPSQDILAWGDLVKVTQTSSTPTDYLSVELNSPTEVCLTSFFVPTEVWCHLIVTFNHYFTLYLNGHVTSLTCTQKAEMENYPEAQLMAGGSGDVYFALDDVQLLFDILPYDTLRSYKEITGYKQTIFIRVELTSQTWDNDLLNDERNAHIILSQLVRTKVLETLQYRSNLTDVVVERFSPGGVVANVTLVYDEVHYQDILLLEEALFVNNSFNGLAVKDTIIDSTSVPNSCPDIAAISLNSMTLLVNWTEVNSFYHNGVFQGYKLLHRETDTSSYTQYTVDVVYGNHTEFLISGLRPLTNYTVRVLAFTLSGDGFLSDSLFSVITMDGPVTDSPNITLTNISSTAIYANWTMLPNSTEIYAQLLGYYVYMWKQSDINSSFVVNVTAKNYILMENLEKWTTYCFNVSGYTGVGVGPDSQTQCIRTFEDAPESTPSNVTITEVTATSIHLHWFRPPYWAVPGIIRYYNLSYRLLNSSNSEIISIAHDEMSYNISGLNPYSFYQINISAFTVSTGPHYTLSVMTGEAEPSAAPNISLLNVSSTVLIVNWTSLPKAFHNGILLGYRIFIWRKSQGEKSPLNTTVGNSVLSKQFNELSKWTIYCVHVTAFTSVGDGPSQLECSRTFEDAPEEPPSNFSVELITNSSVKLRWSPPPFDSVPGIIRQYNLTYRNLNYTRDHLTQLNFIDSVTSHTIENLIGLTLYEINITSSTVSFGPWDSILVLTREGAPDVAPNVSWHNVSSTSLQVNIDAIPPPFCNGIVLGYRIYMWKKSEGQSSESSSNISSAESVKTFEELEKYTHYCGQIVAYTRIGEGPRSPVECIRTSEDAPEVSPVNLNTTNITWSSFYLTWDSIDPSYIPGVLRSYRITYKVIDPRYNKFHGAYDGSFLVNSSVSAVNVTGLIGWTNYEVMVNGVTVSDGPGNLTYLKTEEGIPTSPPDQITPTEITSTTILLNWNEIFLPERHGVIKGYKLTYQKSNARNKRDTDLETLSFDANTFTAFLFKLTPFTNYTITLAGFTSRGTGVKNVTRIETAEGIPSVSPKNAHGVNFTGPTTIFLGWGSLSTQELQGRLIGYEVIYRIFSIAGEIIKDPPPQVKKIIYSDINGVKITGLSTYTTYKVTVSALSGGGNGVKSETLYVATCRCFKHLTTNYWNYQPYTNISSHQSSFSGFFPYLLDMVTLACCQTCLEHGTSDVNYLQDGQGNPSIKTSDIDVKRGLSLSTDFSFPIYGFHGQQWYSKYYGYAGMVEAVGTVFFTKKPDYSLTQGNALLDSVMSIVPFLAIAVIFAYIAGVIMWALEHDKNEEEFSKTFLRGASNGFWWAYITMTTVGYGDKTARTMAGRIFAVIWVLVGLVISSLLIGTISSAFTSSTTVVEPSVKTLYGAKIAALHDSPDHKLGVRRNAEVNTRKEYWSLKELHKDLINKKLDGILVDAYVADSRRDLFADSRLLIKQIIDIKASYGVVMGKDSTKLRKCFNQFWSENKAKKLAFIEAHSEPVVATPPTTEEVLSETFNPTGYMYAITLNICLVGLCLGVVSGCLYEVVRRRRRKTKVEPEVTCLPNDENIQHETLSLSEVVKEKLRKLKAKHRKQIKDFVMVQTQGTC